MQCVDVWPMTVAPQCTKTDIDDNSDNNERDSMMWCTVNALYSSDIQSALLINSVDRAVDQFVVLSDIALCLLSSKCHHLVNYACKTATFWYKILQEKLCRYWIFMIFTSHNSIILYIFNAEFLCWAATVEFVFYFCDYQQCKFPCQLICSFIFSIKFEAHPLWSVV